MEKKIFEGVVEYDKEDGGQALIATINCIDEADPMFVRIQSWETEDPNQDKAPDHIIARQYEGKKVRLTLEIIEDDV